MSQRFYHIACGVLIGVCLATLLPRLALALKIGPGAQTRAASAYLGEIMTLVRDNYVDAKKATVPELTNAALHGMVVALDPHSEFLEAKSFKELEDDMSSEFGGIGIQVELRNGRICVITPMPDTPGDRANIKRGDEITSIDGVPLDKPAIDSVVEKLRGKAKTHVAVGFYRPSESRAFAVTFIREMIKTESVREVRVLPSGIGYLQITQFTERTGEEFNNALNLLAAKNATALIIDLRNNPGGLLEAAVEVAEPFFKKGELIVYTQGRRLQDRDDYRAEADDKPITAPVAILLNANSASAAEVLAGALKDTRRAFIVGERSFGKGSVQSIFTLREGEGVKLTTARYYTPSGITIHERGITPNVEVVLSAEDDENIALQLARPELAGDPAAFKERFDMEPVADRQLEAAVNVLQGIIIFDEITE